MIGIARRLLDTEVIRAARIVMRRASWRDDFARLSALRNTCVGRRAFLVGSGPSLTGMDLAPLAGEFVCVVNMGVRAIGAQLDHADMHVVVDTNRYRRFAKDIEAIALLHPLPYRFLSRRARRIWNALPQHAATPLFLASHIDRLARRGRVEPLEDGLVRAPSVLITAAILLEFMGFSPIHVIGCDLDYDTAGPYFYDLGKLDAVHESDPKVMRRRPGMHDVDRHFAMLREDFARRGHTILNAGVGGKLHSLQRVEFTTLFA